MEKKLLRKDIGEAKEFNAATYRQTYSDINEVINFFTKAKEQGATHVDFLACTDYDGFSESCDAQPVCLYEESDEDAKIRIQKEAEKEKLLSDAKERLERVEYQRLKAKFG